MDYLIGFVLGASFVLLLVKRRFGDPDAKEKSAGASSSAGDESKNATPAESEAAPRGEDPAVETEESRHARLYSIARELDHFFEESAQPADLLRHSGFLKGVELLAEGFSREQLLGYASGSNSIISCQALEALARRQDEEDLVEPILSRVNQLGYWPQFFALRAVDLRTSEPVLARVLSRIDGSWYAPHAERILLGFIDSRSRKEPRPTLDDLRSTATEEQMNFLASYLPGRRTEFTGQLCDALSEWEGRHADEDLLRTIGRLWDQATAREPVIVELEGLVEAVPKLEALLEARRRRSILIVGEPGAGKTTLLKLLARRLLTRDWLVFEAGASQLLAGQSYIGELEQRVTDLIQQLGAGKKVLWIIPGLQNMLWAGRHRYSPTGVLELILPSIESGEITVAAEVSPRSEEKLIQSLPRIRSAFERCSIEPMGDEEALELAREWLARWTPLEDGPTARELVSDELLSEAFQLARQYLGDRAAPGNLLDLLKETVRRVSAVAPSRELEIGGGDLVATLAQLTGLPSSILDDRERLELPGLREFFQKRVLGQPEAVECLLERVAMIKAGLTDPTRPLGVFLFAGPTGTGKTEIAKTLTEFLFGSPDRMMRLDMSEFNTRDSIRGILGDDDAHGDGTALVHQIRRQPFSVVLLDEFEKADPIIWDLFLQIFDDGRLTDKRGNTADFRHSIIIMTTNLGGDVTATPNIGFSERGERTVQQGVEKAMAEAFRPEFINRIDRVVAFRPLDRSTMREILYKELDLVLHRRGLRNRSWAVEWEESAIEFLLARGFDRSLGARPLKRAIERYLLSPLALTIVNHQFPGGDQFLFVRSDGDAIVVEFIDPDAPEETALEPAPESAAGEELTLGRLALDARGTREELMVLRSRYEELEELTGSEGWRSRKESCLGELSSAGFWSSPERFRVLGQAEYMDRIEAGLRTAGSLVRRFADLSPDGGKNLSRDLMRRLAQQVYLLDEACSGLEADRPRDAFLLVRAGRSPGVDPLLRDEFAARLAKMYRGWAAKRRMDIRVVTEGADPYSILFAISGYAAYSILEGESGLHVLEVPDDGRLKRVKVRVEVAPQPDAPPGGGPGELLEQAMSELERRREDTASVVRSYREKPSPLIRDSGAGWRTGKLRQVLDGDFDLIGK